MTIITSRSTGRTARHMTGKLNDYLGVTYSYVGGHPCMSLMMTGEDGRKWFVDLDANETAHIHKRVPIQSPKSAQ